MKQFVSQRSFEKLGICNKYYRHFGLRFYLLYDFLPPGSQRNASTLFRIKRDFSERDRQVLSLLGPHFAQALANTRAFAAARAKLDDLANAMNQDGRGIILLGVDGKIQWMTECCPKWLRFYFRDTCGNVDNLPNSLERRLQQQRALHDFEQTITNPREPIVIEGPGRRLIVRWREEFDGGMTLLLHEQLDTNAQTLRRFGLISRELEVAGWIAQGKTNPEIGTILNISPRTVDRHVERILQKLGVENRSGIMLKARDSF